VAEQSHKREMSEALRGDFERLRQRLEGEAERTAPRVAERPAEPLVLTPPRAEKPDPEEAPESATPEPEPVSDPSGAEAAVQLDEVEDEQLPAPSRPKLRSIFRRG
jgi:hypothetical protein